MDIDVAFKASVGFDLSNVTMAVGDSYTLSVNGGAGGDGGDGGTASEPTVAIDVGYLTPVEFPAKLEFWFRPTDTAHGDVTYRFQSIMCPPYTVWALDTPGLEGSGCTPCEHILSTEVRVRERVRVGASRNIAPPTHSI